MRRGFDRADGYGRVGGGELFDPAVDVVESVAGDFLAVDLEDDLARVELPAEEFERGRGEARVQVDELAVVAPALELGEEKAQVEAGRAEERLVLFLRPVFGLGLLGGVHWVRVVRGCR